jgi:hypothetical protein
MQDMINSGQAWQMEGSIGRAAMDLLESGACMLPLTPHSDAYGNRVPSRDMLQGGSKGTLENSIRFWERVETGEIELDMDEDY